MRELFNQSYQEYIEYMSKNVEDFWTHVGFLSRRNQIMSVIDSLNDDFNFEKLITLETGGSQNLRDGIFGLFMGFATVKTNGTMMAVDTDRNVVDRSYELFKTVIPNLHYEIYEEDSIKFLLELKEIPNLVHLDSWDLNLHDPLPSSLHGWREFTAIENKMPSGSIIIIDDNYIGGTWVDWQYADGRIDRISNTYPMTGKGAIIYHYVIGGTSDWKLIGSQYNVYNNIKIIIQKR